MTIQPLPPSHPPEISVTEVIEPAYERVKQMLFKPFDFTKWIVIGFCAWLAGLGESGGGGNFNWGGSSGGNNNTSTNVADDFRHFYHEASDYVTTNLAWIVPLVVFVVVLLLALWLVVLWLNSRGKFMFLHCVALDVAEIEVPWRKYAAEANSLFRFRIAVGVAGMVLFLPVLGIMAVAIIQMLLQNEINMPAVMLCAALLLVLIVLAIVFGLIHKFTVDFVVPILYLRGGTCLAAWRGEFWQLLAAHPGKFTIYILFQIVLGMAIGALVLAVFIGTCCIACCLSALPFIGTVLLLPVLIFKRAYPLYYLAQYGPQYDVFPKPVPPTPPTPPAPPAPPQPPNPTPEPGPAPTAS